jgi:hypothetical protein
MRKNILPLSLSALLLVTMLCRAQFLDVPNPAAQGLVRGQPYMSMWGQQWLTNRSAISAAKTMFTDPNAGAYIWSVFQPFAFIQNTNALTPLQQTNLTYAGTLTNAVNFGIPVDSFGFGSVGYGSYPNGIYGPPAAGYWSNVVEIANATLNVSGPSSWMTAMVPGLNSVAPILDDFVPGSYVAYLGNTNLPDGENGPYGCPTIFGSFSVSTPYGIANLTYSTNVGMVTLPYPTNNPNWSLYYTNAGIYYYYATNYLSFYTLQSLNPTNLFYVDQFGNSRTFGTNMAVAFIGDMSRGTGITPSQVGAVSTSDATYLKIPGIGTEATNAMSVALSSSNSAALASNSAALASSPYRGTNTAPFATTNAALSANSNFTNGSQRAVAWVSYTATNLFNFTFTNLSSGEGYVIGRTTSTATNLVNSDVFNFAMSPGDVVVLTNLTNCSILKSGLRKE